MKKFTTFQIAQLLAVSDQSVANWIDSGLLRAHRTPGGHRRVERDDLLEFLRVRTMTIPPELRPAVPTILVVDDDKDVAQWLARALEDGCAGYRLLIANDGYTAGQIVTTERPDLVILDLYMPGMDGFEVCRKIKSDERTRGALVLAVSAHMSDEAQQAILAAGAAACLPKPVDAKQLCDLANTLLSNSH